MKYKVKVIQMALRNNKLAESGDVVSESQLTGNAAKLEKEGFIEKVIDDKKLAEEKKAKAEAEARKEVEAKEAFDKAYEEGSLDADQLDSITIKEICEYANKHAYNYDDGARKSDLIEQVLKAEKVEE